MIDETFDIPNPPVNGNEGQNIYIYLYTPFEKTNENKNVNIHIFVNTFCPQKCKLFAAIFIKCNIGIKYPLILSRRNKNKKKLKLLRDRIRTSS